MFEEPRRNDSTTLESARSPCACGDVVQLALFWLACAAAVVLPLLAGAPRREQRVRVLLDRHAVERRHRHDGDLRGRLFTNVGDEGPQPAGGRRIEEVR